MNTLSRLLTGCALVAAFSTGYAVQDKLNIAGTYQCSGFDAHDGAYSNAKLTITLDPNASDFAHNFGSYTLLLVEGDGADKASYTGEIAAHGDLLAIYFQNQDNAGSPTDRGVGIATVSHAQDTKGNFITSFDKFYFEPDYMRTQKGPTGNTGGHGTDHCVKIS